MTEDHLTEDHLRIMDIFKEANLDAGHYLSTQYLMGIKFNIERPLQNKFYKLIGDLIEMGYLAEVEHNRGISLTESGYQLIYGEQT